MFMPFYPVCGAEVSEETRWKAEYEGRVYYFCCKHRLAKFLREPGRYAR
ncbi:MAG: YHS domain-containing protein [Candidatus Korarchaeota archaeon]|nr:YHS domain-containing protein [Candidatus Korarchaeota archaeon]